MIPELQKVSEPLLEQGFAQPNKVLMDWAPLGGLPLMSLTRLAALPTVMTKYRFQDTLEEISG